jgi:hypothetical protein
MIVPRRVLLLLTLAVVSTAGVAACGKTSSDAEKPAAQGTYDPSAPWADYPSTDPRSSVLSYWRLLQIGAYPAAASGYDTTVVSSTGREDFLQALALQRPGVAAQKPRVTGVHDVTGGKVVQVDARNSAGNGGAYSFTVRRSGDKWVLVYDSLLGDSMSSALANAASQRGEAETVAARRSASVAGRYREAALEVLRPAGAAPSGAASRSSSSG